MTQAQGGQGERAVISVHRNPLVNWIWIGGFVLVLGTLIALMPSKPGAGTTPSPVRATSVVTEAKLRDSDEVLAKSTP